jgi:predicted RNA-binding Zn-ribbon protein involved in translation (DUF1610 family)
MIHTANDPFNHEPIYVFQTTMNGWGVARGQRGTYDYLQPDLRWAGMFPYNFVREVDAQEALSRYLNLGPTDESKSCNGGIMQTITPLLIDDHRLAVKFKCPTCGMNHLSMLRADNWHKIQKEVERKCPKLGGDAFLIKLWLNNPSECSAPTGDITRLPQWDCQDCWATGEYTGFMAVEPCKRCFPPTS